MQTPQSLMLFGLLAALVLTSGCSREAADAPAAATDPLVRVVAVRSEVTIPQIQGVGTAAWRRETILGFTSGGQIARVLVNEGDRVRRGQLLALLDTTTVQAELAAAQAEANRAASQAGRLASLFKSGWVTKGQWEAAQAGAQSSAAEVKARRFALDTARIVAPGNGLILARLAESRQIIAAGAPVLTLGEAAGGYVIRVPLNDRAAAGIATGAPARVMFEALGPEPLIGQVLEIGGKANQATGTFDVEIALPADSRLRSGMIGFASITSNARNASPRIIVPASAMIAPRAGEALVYVIDADNRARLRSVTVGETSDAGVEILGGLTGAETLAISGFDRLKNGIRVRRADPQR